MPVDVTWPCRRLADRWLRDGQVITDVVTHPAPERHTELIAQAPSDAVRMNLELIYPGGTLPDALKPLCDQPATALRSLCDRTEEVLAASC